MKFVSYQAQSKARFGAVIGSGVVDLSHRFISLKAAIEADALDTLASEAREATADLLLKDLHYLPTIVDPSKIICIGVNYANRNAEYKDGSAAPKYPSVFMRTPESLTGHLQPLLDPPESDQLDYEGEIVLVVGKPGRRISKDDAHQHIAGLTVMNEGSLRDWVRHGKFNVTPGKNFVSSGSLGPFLVTPEETDPMGTLQVITRVNGEERQNDNTDNLMFPFRTIIAYVSTFYQLNAGDIIATGTPNGAGARFDPPRYLQPGDTVEVEVPGVGLLSNTVKAE